MITAGNWGNVVTLKADNLSDSAIKDVRIGFAAWNDDRLPINLDGPDIYDGEIWENPDLKELQSMAGRELKGDILEQVFEMNRY